MLKNFAKRKIIVTTFAFIILFITLLFPTSEENNQITTSYINGKTDTIYLLNKDNFVSRTEVLTMQEDLISKVRELLNFLTINSSKANYIPSIFTPVIPSNTKIISLDIQDKIVKINFSKEFLNIPSEYENKVIECLTYTLTNLNDIDGVIIYVEGNLLDSLPNSKKKLPHVLTKDIGVNVIYDIKNLKNVQKTTTYYLANDQNISYYVPVTLLENNDKDKVEIIIERLKSSPHLQTNLISYLKASAELSNYELLENEIKLSFNDKLFEGLQSEDIKEQIKYSIALSLEDTLNIKKVSFNE